jgi:hypothetical protein
MLSWAGGWKIPAGFCETAVAVNKNVENKRQNR